MRHHMEIEIEDRAEEGHLSAGAEVEIVGPSIFGATNPPGTVARVLFGPDLDEHYFLRGQQAGTFFPRSSLRRIPAKQVSHTDQIEGLRGDVRAAERAYEQMKGERDESVAALCRNIEVIGLIEKHRADERKHFCLNRASPSPHLF